MLTCDDHIDMLYLYVDPFPIVNLSHISPYLNLLTGFSDNEYPGAFYCLLYMDRRDRSGSTFHLSFYHSETSCVGTSS